MRTPAVLRNLALFFTLPVLPALAQDATQPAETVEVTANALVGVWKIGFPDNVAKKSFFSALEWGPSHPHFCRIEQTGAKLTANCFPYPDDDGTVTVENSHFHMAWGTMMLRIVIDGALQSGTQLAAHIAVKLSGVALEDPNVSSGEKLPLSTDAPDAGGNAALLTNLLNETSDGHIGENIDSKSSFVHPPEATGLRTLGAIESVIYLGTVPEPLPPNAKVPAQPDFFHVYDVEFSNGHRLCGLHQRDDGVLDGFRCI